MKNKIILIIYILSFTIAVFLFAHLVTRSAEEMSPDSFGYYEESGARVFYAHNTPSMGLIFSMTKSGKVVRMFKADDYPDAFIKDISVYGNNLYVLLLRNGYDKNNENYNVYYRVIRLDEKLRVEAESPEFITGDLSNGEFASGFSAEPDGIFITVLRNDGSYARVYGIKESDLVEDENPDGKEIKVSNIRSRKSTEERFFCQAEYAYGELYVRTDKDAPEGRFAVNTDAWNAAANLRLSLGQFLSLYSKNAVWFVTAVIVWFIVLTVIIRALLGRNRTLYFLIIAEAVVFAICAFGTYNVAKIAQDNKRTEHIRFAALSLMGLSEEAGLMEYGRYSLSEFYDMDRYFEIRDTLTDFVLREGNYEIFYDVMAVRLRDNLIIASASGLNLQNASSVYGDELTDLTNKIYRGGKYAAVDLYIEGQQYTVVAVADQDVSANYALVALINSVTEDRDVWVDNRRVFFSFLIVFAIGAALTALVWYLQLRDYHMLENAMKDTAFGRSITERPRIIGRDLKDMWDSIYEINKRVEGIEYNRMRILEAYYRFAPKNVEVILGKESITEVYSGDSKVINGTVALLAIDFRRESDLRRIDSVIGQIGEYQKEHAAIMVGRAPDMSRVQMLFLDQEVSTVQFFTELFNYSTHSSDRLCYSAFLHYDQCSVGVLGTEDETKVRLGYESQRVQEEISIFISELKLGLVISEAIKLREKVTAPLRFIGCFDAGDGSEGIKLYEMLDTYPVAERAHRIRTLDKFNEALNLYYERDFYLARTKFSELLKEDPNDMLLKWYIFESDRYLNEGTDGDGYKLLHNERGGIS